MPLPPTGRAVGVDVGVARFATTSDGEIIANPRFLTTTQARITDLQRRKERAKRGSGNRRRLRRQLAREWRHVRNQRRDFHHKVARALVSDYGLIAVENLNVDGLAAGILAKSVHDAGWSQFLRILTDKASIGGISLSYYDQNR